MSFLLATMEVARSQLPNIIPTQPPEVSTLLVSSTVPALRHHTEAQAPQPDRFATIRPAFSSINANDHARIT